MEQISAKKEEAKKEKEKRRIEKEAMKGIRANEAKAKEHEKVKRREDAKV